MKQFLSYNMWCCWNIGGKIRITFLTESNSLITIFDFLRGQMASPPDSSSYFFISFYNLSNPWFQLFPNLYQTFFWTSANPFANLYRIFDRILESLAQPCRGLSFKTFCLNQTNYILQYFYNQKFWPYYPPTVLTEWNNAMESPIFFWRKSFSLTEKYWSLILWPTSLWCQGLSENLS